MKLSNILLLNIALLVIILPLTMCLKFVTRSDWEARSAKKIVKFNGPAPYIIIHHSENPGYCETTEKCSRSVRSIQSYHMNERHWDDIGYSFLIGGDGKVYIGRGFNVVAAHAPNYNNKSVGICLLGNYQDELPPEKMLNTTQEFIEYALSNGHVTDNFKLLGHRQVRATNCPGDRLYEEIKTWPEYAPHP